MLYKEICSKFKFWFRFCVSSWRCIFKSDNVALTIVPITERQYVILQSIASDLNMPFEEAVYHVWNRNYDVFGYREKSLEDL